MTPGVVRRQDHSTEAVLGWVGRVLTPGRRTLGLSDLMTVLAPMGWDVTFPEGERTAVTVDPLALDRMFLVRYDGSGFHAVSDRAPVSVPTGPRISVVTLVHSGEAVVERAGQQYAVGPGDVVLHPPRGRIRLEWGPGRRTYVLLTTSLFGRRPDAVLRDEDVVMRDAPLAPAAERLLDVLYDDDVDEIAQLTATQALQGLVAATVASAIDRGPAPPEPGLREQIRAVLLERYADPSLDADAVARELRISRRYLFAQFESSTDSFATTLRDIRLDHAAEMLAGADDAVTVRRVAREAGFAGTAQLGRAFRERFGLTPTQFRTAALRGQPLPDPG
ncbi:AraC family transcriptional regulator [Cellulomonas iranensis]|uniref:helix-turn-helix transcriptional regulator n=1 Tax=Cellulomonas iranensis TaxID=76862 RepID=UPI001CF56977|nr:AraC family transcriptional regulator [Cellulomonas iranensis]UCN14060.1 AraC family transcriptional regulator [Cellulomonas iranensis]